MRRTTIFLDEEIHEELRREAFRSRVSMAEVIRLRIAGTAKKAKPNKTVDPLMKVAGICSGEILSSNIDDELYG